MVRTWVHLAARAWCPCVRVLITVGAPRSWFLDGAWLNQGTESLTREAEMASTDDHEVALPDQDRKGDVIELELLVTSNEWALLEVAAHRAGLTIGQLLRQLLRDYWRGAGRSHTAGAPSDSSLCHLGSSDAVNESETLPTRAAAPGYSNHHGSSS